MIRKVTAAFLASAVALSLSACTPPMPPEVLAALAEQEYTCIEGEAQLSVPPSTTDMGPGWALAASEACPGMNIAAVADEFENSDLIFGTSAEQFAVCKPSVTVPFAVDGAVLVYSSADGSSVNLTPELVGKIFSGEISDWSDAEITVANSGFELPASPIQINKSASGQNVAAFQAWLDHLGVSLDFSDWEKVDPSADDLFSFPEGTLSLVPYSLAAEQLFTPVGIIMDSADPTSAIIADAATLGSAATQFKIEKTANSVSVSYDPSLTPTAAAGQDVASTPYGAVYTHNLAICGEPTLLKRAIAKFILRQDQQGAIAATYFVQIPEFLRVENLSVVSVGLPTPSFNPEDFQQ